jgi:hypothetical protein
MDSNYPGGPRVLHTLPGRLRVHLPGSSRQGRNHLESRLRQVRGIHSARASTLTDNVLIHFDPATTNPATLLSALFPAQRPALDPALFHPPSRTPGSRKGSALVAMVRRLLDLWPGCSPLEVGLRGLLGSRMAKRFLALADVLVHLLTGRPHRLPLSCARLAFAW